MKILYTIKKTLFAGGIVFFTTTLFGQAFVHPGLMSNKKDLDFVKSKIANNEQPWKAAFDRLKSANPQNRRPSPRTTQPDENVTPNANDTWDVMTTDGSTAYACALLWYYSGDKRYADKAVEILNAWSVFVSHTNSLYLSWAVPHFLNAAEIMRYTPNSGWSNADVVKFSTMVRTKFLPILDRHGFRNNAMYSTIEAQLACAIFLDDRTIFNTRVNQWRSLIADYLYLTSDGRVPKSVNAPVSYWGTSSGQAYINGQCQETCRDLNHTKLGTTSIMHAAEYAWKQGVDLWKEEKERLISFAELHANWMMGKKAVPQNLCTGGGISCAGRKGTAVNGTPPCNQVGWEVLCNHYVTRLQAGSRLPVTQQMLLSRRPEGSINDRNLKFETLTSASLPLNIVVTDLEEEFTKEETDIQRIFPNPSQDGIFNLSQPANWKVTNIAGKELKSGNGSQINLADYPKGIYLITTNNKVERIIIN